VYLGAGHDRAAGIDCAATNRAGCALGKCGGHRKENGDETHLKFLHGTSPLSEPGTQKVSKTTTRPFEPNIVPGAEEVKAHYRYNPSKLPIKALQMGCRA
jgi:hypothetical protein